MAKPETVLAAIRKAAHARASEVGQRNAVQATLGKYGHFDLPNEVRRGRAPWGGTVRTYIWLNTPAGDIVLIAGPSVEGEVKRLDDVEVKGDVSPGGYIETMEVDDREAGTAAMRRAADRARSRAKPAKTRRTTRKRKPRAPTAAPPPRRAYKPLTTTPRRGYRAPGKPGLRLGSKRKNPDEDTPGFGPGWREKPAPEFEDLAPGQLYEAPGIAAERREERKARKLMEGVRRDMADAESLRARGALAAALEWFDEDSPESIPAKMQVALHRAPHASWAPILQRDVAELEAKVRGDYERHASGQAQEDKYTELRELLNAVEDSAINTIESLDDGDRGRAEHFYNKAKRDYAKAKKTVDWAIEQKEVSKSAHAPALVRQVSQVKMQLEDAKLRLTEGIPLDDVADFGADDTYKAFVGLLRDDGYNTTTTGLLELAAKPGSAVRGLTEALAKPYKLEDCNLAAAKEIERAVGYLSNYVKGLDDLRKAAQKYVANLQADLEAHKRAATSGVNKAIDQALRKVQHELAIVDSQKLSAEDAMYDHRVKDASAMLNSLDIEWRGDGGTYPGNTEGSPWFEELSRKDKHDPLSSAFDVIRDISAPLGRADEAYNEELHDLLSSAFERVARQVNYLKGELDRLRTGKQEVWRQAPARGVQAGMFGARTEQAQEATLAAAHGGEPEGPAPVDDAAMMAQFKALLTEALKSV